MLLGNGYEPDPRVRDEARALVAGGFSVSILAWDRGGTLPPAEESDGIRVDRMAIRSTDGRGRGQAAFLAAFLLRAVAEGRRREFDVVWCHDLDTLPAGRILGALSGAPVVFDAHESYPDMVADSVGPAVTRWLRWLERHLVRRVAATVTVGDRLAARFQSLGSPRTVVAGNWKDPADFDLSPAKRRDVRRRFGIPPEAWLVTFVGWLSAERKIAELFDAIRGLDGVHLLIAGRGPLEESCRHAAAAGDRVRFAGWVPPSEVPAVTAAGDAVFYGFESRNGNARYSAPNKLFEAIAAGVPVITGPFGEIEDVVRRFGCGVVVPDYRPETLRDGLRRAMRREEFAGGCAAARERYSRARADQAIRALASGLTVAEGTAMRGAATTPAVATERRERTADVFAFRRGHGRG